MMIKIEATKTYWIGITETQLRDLRGALIVIVESNILVQMTAEQSEAFSELRQTILNV